MNNKVNGLTGQNQNTQQMYNLAAAKLGEAQERVGSAPKGKEDVAQKNLSLALNNFDEAKKRLSNNKPSLGNMLNGSQK